MKVAIYCRISREKQHLENQIEICKKACEKEGHEIYKIYTDIITGASTSRSSFNELLKDMRHYKFDGIMVTKLDRIGRSLQHLLSLFNEFNQKGIHFIAVTQHIDTSTSAGRLQMQIMGAFAEFERNIISERTKEGLMRATGVGKRGKDKIPRKRRGGLKKKVNYYEK